MSLHFRHCTEILIELTREDADSCKILLSRKWQNYTIFGLMTQKHEYHLDCILASIAKLYQLIPIQMQDGRLNCNGNSQIFRQHAEKDSQIVWKEIW